MTAAKLPPFEEISASIGLHFQWLKANVKYLTASAPHEVFRDTFYVGTADLVVAESLKRMLVSEDPKLSSLAGEAVAAAKSAIRAASELAQAFAGLESHAAIEAAKNSEILAAPLLGLLGVGQGILQSTLDAERRVSQIGRWARITTIGDWRNLKSGVREQLVKLGIEAEVAYDLFPGEESAKSRMQTISGLRKLAPNGEN